MSVLTWNIQCIHGASVLDPLEAVSPLPDIVTLQEVAIQQKKAIRCRLQQMGYQTVYSGRNGAETTYGNVIAARTRVSRCGLTSFHFPIPQLAAHAIVDTLDGPMNVVTVHIPNGSKYLWRKIDAFDALKRLVLRLKGQPLIITGDFNEPYWGLQDDHIVTWGQDTQDGDRWIAVGPSERWDAAVRWFFEAQEESGLRVAFWEAHGHGAMEPSYLTRGRQPKCWYDHIFVSDDFVVQKCDYRHEFRGKGLSDHSALVTVLTHAPGKQ
jgi:endonuclease/exonuclease/phosphatase family metal-dependent hydrolase